MDDIRQKRGLSGGALHLLAMGLMLCDHLWATVVPGNFWLTCVGRLAFPIFAFLLAEGFAHTGSFKNYLGRMVFWAVIAEIPFNLMYAGSAVFPFHQNVLWTFALALVCLRAIRWAEEKQKPWLTLAAALAVSAAGWLAGMVLMVDYFGAGVLTVILFYLFRQRSRGCRLAQLCGMLWINGVLIAGQVVPVQALGRVWELPVQGLAVLSLVPIWLYRGQKGPGGRAFRLLCYAFYPAHMLALGLLMRWRG